MAKSLIEQKYNKLYSKLFIDQNKFIKGIEATFKKTKLEEGQKYKTKYRPYVSSKTRAINKLMTGDDGD